MQPAAVLFSEAIAAYSEHFKLIVADLLAMPAEEPLLVEGTSLLPGLVKPVIARPTQGIWIVPTETFQRRMYPRRGPWVESILAECEKPEIAFKNWMDRDVAFSRWVIEQVVAFEGAYIEVDGERTIDENAVSVAKHFGLG